MSSRERRVCCNPTCTQMASYRKGSMANMYCSHKCRSTFSPAMHRVCKENKIAESPAALRDLIREMKRENRENTDMAVMFGVTTQTFRCWCQKLGA